MKIGAGMTILIEMTIYKQTLFSRVPHEPFNSPFGLSLSKGERFAQDRRVERRPVNCDTVSEPGERVG